MGKAIDLPDPLDAASPLNGASLHSDSAGGASSADADDILAQLAGDEIDRLLAEADVERTDDAPDAPAVPAGQGLAAVQAPAQSFESVLDDAASAPASPFVAPDASPIDVTALSPTALLTDGDAGTIDGFDHAAALDNPTFDSPSDLPPEASHTGAHIPMSLSPDDDEPSALPIYLRPLGWLNAPLDAMPDSVRETIGKIALLTLFNAVAVLIYVLVFRK